MPVSFWESVRVDYRLIVLTSAERNTRLFTHDIWLLIAQQSGVLLADTRKASLRPQKNIFVTWTQASVDRTARHPFILLAHVRPFARHFKLVSATTTTTTTTTTAARQYCSLYSISLGRPASLSRSLPPPLGAPRERQAKQRGAIAATPLEVVVVRWSFLWQSSFISSDSRCSPSCGSSRRRSSDGDHQPWTSSCFHIRLLPPVSIGPNF